jgi:hypothetical protein
MARKLRVGFVGLGRVFDLNVRGYLIMRRRRFPRYVTPTPLFSLVGRANIPAPGRHATLRISYAPTST